MKLTLADQIEWMSPSQIQNLNSLQMEAALSRGDNGKLGSQSLLLTTSHRLKSCHKDGPHSKLNSGHWPRHYDRQKGNSEPLH